MLLAEERNDLAKSQKIKLDASKKYDVRDLCVCSGVKGDHTCVSKSKRSTISRGLPFDPPNT